MAFTTNDLQALLGLLEEQPQSRAQLRMLLLTEELETLPGRIDRLTEAVEQLAKAQQRTEQALGQLAQAQQRTEERLEQLAEAQRRTEERLERLEATVQALAEAQRRTEERLEQLAEAQRRTEERLERLEATVQALAEAQRRTEERLQELMGWQRGEAGRRAGERYERRIVRRAWTLFQGGQGGAPDRSSVQQHLSRVLQPLLAEDILPDEEEDPFLADVIWWKDNQFVIVEASLQVNGNDVVRAAQRAETLRRANVQAMGVVIGQEWTGPHIRQQAEARGVQWWVGDDLSEELLTFRRLSS